MECELVELPAANGLNHSLIKCAISSSVMNLNLYWTYNSVIFIWNKFRSVNHYIPALMSTHVYGLQGDLVKIIVQITFTLEMVHVFQSSDSP